MTATIEQLWEQGRRRYVIDCLERDEFPFAGWDKDYPDLATERLATTAKENEQQCG